MTGSKLVSFVSFKYLLRCKPLITDIDTLKDIYRCHFAQLAFPKLTATRRTVYRPDILARRRPDPRVDPTNGQLWGNPRGML